MSKLFWPSEIELCKLLFAILIFNQLGIARAHSICMDEMAAEMQKALNAKFCNFMYESAWKKAKLNEVEAENINLALNQVKTNIFH